MEAQACIEKNRLEVIDQQVKEVEHKLVTRLPAQYRHLAAMVCGEKWRMRTFKPQDAAATVKKMRLELGTFDYRVKEQAELLTRYLIDLDGVLSYGDADIKSARKALVTFIHQLLPVADNFKEHSAKLKQFGERTLREFEVEASKSLAPCDSDPESEEMHVNALFEESGDESSESQDEEELGEDENMEEPVGDNNLETMKPDAEAEDEDEDLSDADAEHVGQDELDAQVGDEDELEAEDENQAGKCIALPEESHRVQSNQALDTDINSLPVWHPYYQLQRRQDGIYLIARLNNIDPRNVHVQWNEYNGVLRISGFRLPTQKDIVMSRLSGAPTFGRFEIVEQFPRNMFNMKEATQHISEDVYSQWILLNGLLCHSVRLTKMHLLLNASAGVIIAAAGTAAFIAKRDADDKHMTTPHSWAAFVTGMFFVLNISQGLLLTFEGPRANWQWKDETHVLTGVLIYIGCVCTMLYGLHTSWWGIKNFSPARQFQLTVLIIAAYVSLVGRSLVLLRHDNQKAKVA
ncbi:hypothetical protein PsorP6_014518 [Peronosclerospora sorghi]|uniref:Uncharacterized protein n=1 Tax=Peronosclerospora sorghi TaxID=230839 RepID=A0ACC0VSR6_9STRA|nr:hypothetical protein PsorP6_014518 [Peronosclerospora sorghi]